VLDIINPLGVTIVGGADTPDFAFGVAVEGSYAYVAGYTSGLHVLSAQCESPPLSVLFTDIAATSDGGGVVLSWKVEADEPVSGFEVYRRLVPDGAERSIRDVLLDPRSRTLRDDEIELGRMYEYFVVAVLPDGGRIRSRPVSVETRALALILNQNFPNPFNPATKISFVLPAKARAQVLIYDVQGRLLRKLLDEEASPGFREVLWDGRNERGGQVASGVYFYELRTGKNSLTRKMVLLK
jgi:hypothetical protein